MKTKASTGIALTMGGTVYAFYSTKGDLAKLNNAVAVPVCAGVGALVGKYWLKDAWRGVSYGALGGVALVTVTNISGRTF